jgi:hypothetical protein
MLARPCPTAQPATCTTICDGATAVTPTDLGGGATQCVCRCAYPSTETVQFTIGGVYTTEQLCEIWQANCHP